MTRRSALKLARTTFLAFHLVAIVVLSLPGPGRLSDRGVWKSPQNQTQFKLLTTKLKSLGLESTPELVERRLWNLTQRFLTLRQVVTKPFQAYESGVGFRQSWRMFSNPQTHPARVEVALDSGDGFQVVFNSAERASIRGADLKHHRIRKLFGRTARTQHQYAWVRFTRWVKQHASREYPSAKRLRVRKLRRSTPRPFDEQTEVKEQIEDQRLFQLEAGE